MQLLFAIQIVVIGDALNPAFRGELFWRVDSRTLSGPSRFERESLR